MNALKVLAALALLIALSSCGGSSNSGAAAVDTQTDFTGLIEQLFAQTADTTDPIELDELDLSFSDQDNPAAFDSLL